MPPKVDAAASAPAASGQFSPGQRVTVSGRHGVVKFFGVTQFAAGVWVGIALDDKVGKNDGSVQGVNYFTCDPSHGIFVRPTNVLPATQAPKADGKAPPSAKPAAAAPTVSAPPPAAAAPPKAAAAAAAASQPAPPPKAAAAAAAPVAAASSPPAKAGPTSPSAPAVVPPSSPRAKLSASPGAGATASDAPSPKSLFPSATPAAAAAAAASAPPAKAPGAAGAAAAAVSAPAKAAAVAAPAKAAAPPSSGPSSGAASPASPLAAAPAAVTATASAAAKPGGGGAKAPAAAKQPGEASVVAKATSQSRTSSPSAHREGAAKVSSPPKASSPSRRASAAHQQQQHAAAAAAAAGGGAAEEEAKKELEKLKAEVARLEKVLHDSNSELAQLKAQGDKIEEENRQAEKARKEAAAANASKAGEVEALRQKVEAARQEEAALLKEQAALEAEKLELQRETEELQEAALRAAVPSPKEGAEGEGAEGAEGEGEGGGGGGAAQLTKEQLLELEKLRNQVALEKELQELAELELEEVNLKIADARSALTEMTESPVLSEEQQIMWHKKALISFFDDHRTEMRKLRRRQGALERAQQASQSKHQTEDLSVLRRSVDQLTGQIDQLKQQNEVLRQQVEERQGLREESNEMTQVQEELEAALLEELEWKREREAQLEALAQQLYAGQGELQRRRQEERGKVARLETRLKNLKAQQDVTGGGGVSAQGPVTATGTEQPPVAAVKKRQDPEDAKTDELSLALRTAEARVAAVEAEAWEACIPPALREEAELGQSFHTICALHNCLHKSRLVSRSIHANYIEDAILATLQADLPMGWLCSACVAACEIAYEAVGVLGRLHSSEVSSYITLIRKPAVVACAEGEHTLDAALSALLMMLEEGAGQVLPLTPEERGLQEVLSSLSAQCAQLRSLQTTIFKDQPFASWQAAGFAVEALRAACACALYASDDAGGSRLQRWQALYTKANALARRLALHSQAPVAERGVLIVEPSEPPPMRRKRIQTEEGGEALDPDENAIEPDDRDPNVLAEEGHLTKGLLDSLLRQASILSAGASAEPRDDASAAKLDKAFALAEAHVEGLGKVIEQHAEGPDAPLPTTWPPTPPWELAREAARERIEEAERDAPAQKEELEKQLQEVEDALAAAEMQLAATKEEVEHAEREFSVARIDADRFNLAEAQVARMQNQLKSSEEQRVKLEQELQQEKELLAKMEAETAETRKQCRQLQVQIAEAERRLQKRYNSQIPVEEVVSLRRACVRQQREILAVRRRIFGDPTGLVALEGGGGGGGGAPGSGEKDGDSPTGLGRRRGSVVSVKSHRSGRSARSIKSTRSGRGEAYRQVDAESCWADLQETQRDLIMEQARTKLVNLEEPHFEYVPEMQRKKLESLAKTSCEIRQDVTALIREAADPAHLRRHKQMETQFASVALTRFLKAADPAHLRRHKQMETQFASVALTRFLKESAAAAERGPAAKVSVPVPAASPHLAKNFGFHPSVSVLVDLKQFRSVHHAML